MAELTVLGMRIVDEVAARGSFTAAADALGYTQSAVSRQVALMEQAAGATLFERLARGVRPTAAGVVLLRHTGAVLQRIDAAALELQSLGEQVEDRLTLGAFPTALAALVPRALARLQRVHPGIAVRLREGGSPAQLRRLRAGRIHVAVIALGAGLDYELGDLAATPLLTGTPRLAVGAGHRFARRDWVGVGELEGERWIVGDPEDGGPQFGPWPTLTGTPEIAYTARDWPARLGLVAAGLGVATVPSLLAGAVPAGVEVVAVDDPRPQRREVVAVTRPVPSRGAAALVGVLREEAAAAAPATGGSSHH